MQSIPTTPQHDKVILIHNGALGDFLLSWPSLWVASLYYRDANLLYAGNADRMRWLEPLGYRLCSGDMRRAVESLYGAASCPPLLKGWRILWPVVQRQPRIPNDACHLFLPSLPGLPGLTPHASASGHTHGKRHARQCQLDALAAVGVPVRGDWLRAFRDLFKAAPEPSGPVLLFPGAGHEAKQWPLVNFFELAGMLNEIGMLSLFVAGPTELERGMDFRGRAVAAPGSLTELEALISTARCVIGSDTGPLHLSGMMGVPTLALFGPTDPAIWGPQDATVVRLGLDCSPCTPDCSDIRCPAPRCMQGITPHRVLATLETMGIL